MQTFPLTQNAQGFLDQVERIARDVIAPQAGEVDEQARFPRESIEALRGAGLFGLTSAREVGGAGEGLAAAAAVVERIARDCTSTAMIVKMHYCGTAVVEAHGKESLRREIAAGRMLTTLAFSEYGSRSHFWAPVSSARREGDRIALDAEKQLITAAGQCDLYVWSSRPAGAEGLSSIWAVPANSAGLDIPKPYVGMGLRGNGSAPISAQGVTIPADHALGADGAGFDVMMGVVMPWFSIQNQAVSVGLMEGAIERTVAHVAGSKYDYSGAKIADFPQVRANVARMRTKTDMCRAHLIDSIRSLEEGRADAQLRVLEAKVAGAETSIEVLDLAMRSCGGAAYRKDIALERLFRDSRAASVMAPVADALWDFIGKAVCGMPVFA